MKEIKSCAHRIKKMDYIEASNHAAKRMAAGQKQVQCKVCKKWFWEDEYE